MSDGHFVERGTLDLWDDTMRDQRNRIEELEAKLKTYDEIGRALEEDAGQLRAKLAKAVEALESAQESIATFIGVHGYTEESGATDVLDQVNATLAEINGGGDT